MTDMAYVRRSAKSLSEDDGGVEVAVLKSTYVAELFPDTEFGDAPAASEAGVTAIVDAAVA